MKRFSKFLFGIVLFGTSILGVNAQINENVTDYVEDKFFVGSTRFDGNQIIYANDVIAATQNQIKLNLALGMNPFDALTQEIPVYTYSSLFGEWYIQEEDGFKPITDEEEIKKIEENLDIFFVNNVEKELTFEYDGDVTVHHPNVTHEGGVFTLPATLFSFDFEENGVIYSVYTKAENGYTSDLDYGNFAIVEVSDIVAMVGNVPYENLQDAVNASSEDDPAVLLDDLTLTETLLLDGENTDNVLNLNEKTLKGVNGEKLLRVDGKNNTLTILNGTIDFNGSTYIEVGNKTQDEYSNKLIVNSDVTMNAGTYGIVLRGDESSLEFNGTLNLSGEDGLAILGNGTVDQAGTDIKIGTSAKVFANGNGSFAFYLPQAGNVTIEGGEFEADTVIGIKAGTLTINGGEFTAIGEKRTPVRSENGINPTGDVIYIEQNSSYADNIKINVADDAVFTSTNGYLIQEYNVDNDKKALVTGKYATINNLENGRYFTETTLAELELNGVKYGESALNEALNASSEENPVKLLSDVTLTETLLLDGENTNSVLDLNEKTLKGINGEKVLRVDGKDNTLTISNGTIDFNGSTYIEVGNKTQDGYSNKLIVDEDVVMNAGTYGIVLRGDESSLEFNGTLNLSGEDGLAILGNGTVDQAGTDIKIGTSAKVFANGNGSFAFYLPQAGNVTIEGGEFEADTVIGIKAGTLTINGGEFTAIGEKRTPVRSENGINPTGDVIYIEQNSSYADNIKINVADDAVFTSTNGYLIQEYNVDNDKKAIVTGKYTVSHELEKGRYYDDTVVYTTNEQLSSTFNSTDVLQNKVFDVTLNAGDYDFLRINNRDKNHTISKVYIKGSGEESTTLNGFMIDAANDAANEYGKTNIKVLKISDLTFTDEVSIGIENVGQSEVNKVDYVIFENVTFDHNGRSGVFFQGLADLESVKNIVFKDCTFKNVKYGILAKHMNGANITVEDCVFEDLGYNGIQLDNNLSGTIVIDNNDFINTVDRPIRFGNLLADSKVTISNNEFVNAQDSDGQVIKATSVETGAEVTLQANNWGTLETTIKGMFVGNTLTYFDAE